MCQKKNPSRFSIQFDLNNPEHKKVIEILSAKGRNKAQYIADAILCFESNSRNLEETVTEIVTKLLGISPESGNPAPQPERSNDFDFSDVADALSGFKE
ncbi:hypothetical protein [Ructibacterium gallinarum]|uniref:Uncharacterized protein n=1 Tax=Ructibacterium gallinarum TaxID=2779355 RepID=A0A9D5R902_9FIRM|nr:hypothetical protein [Ructibacterium gallinarum]MBE5040540.1 hypothetical protein [Ructibacterium gallinarum]